MVQGKDWKGVGYRRKGKYKRKEKKRKRKNTKYVNEKEG